MGGADAPYDVHELPDFTPECGATLRQTYGTLNEDRSNAIVYQTWYSGRHWDNERTGPRFPRISVRDNAES